MLRTLVQDLQDAIGTTGDRARMVRYLNRAYREYYNRTDLPGALKEQTFQLDPTDYLVTLPWYVGEVRGVKRHDGEKVNVIGPHDQYGFNALRPTPDLFRIVGRRAIHTPLSLESQLTVTIALAQDEPFSVCIKGETASAAQIVETLTFTPGTLSMTTTAQFAKDNPNGIQSISRNGDVTADITVEDGAAVEIAHLPNALESLNHIVIQVTDKDITLATEDRIYDLLYKETFIPLVNDADEIVFPALADAIVWKARSYAAAGSKDELAGQQAILADRKADALFRQAIENRDLEAQQMVQVAPNPIANLW